MDINTMEQAAAQYTLNFQQNISELQALENVLKDNYNKYIDSLANYLDKCKLIEDNYQKALDNYEGKEGKVGITNFYYLIPNNLVIDSYKNGWKYILDSRISMLNTSLDLVNALSSERLLERKVL